MNKIVKNPSGILYSSGRSKYLIDDKMTAQTAFQMMKSAMEKQTKRRNKVEKGWYNLGDPRNHH